MVKLFKKFKGYYASLLQAKRIALILFSIGGLGCITFFLDSLLNGNWMNAATSGSVLLAVFYSLMHFDHYDADGLFGIVSIGALFALVMGATSNFGLDDTGLHAIYPILLMIGIAFRRRPKIIFTIGAALIFWVIGLYFLQRNGFYIDRSNPFTLVSKTIFIIWMIFFIVTMLQVAIQNLLATNAKLEIAKEEALKAKRVAENASQAKSNFLATMSHELRTPLNAIIGYSEIIEEDHEDDTKNDAKNILTSAKSLLELIDSILEVSELDSDRISVVFENIELTAILNELKVCLEPELEKQNNSLNFNLDPKANVLKTDQKKLTQILENLLQNGNKYTNNGRIDVATSVQQSEFVIAVHDTGIGIPEDKIDHIFDHFHQVENEYDRKFEGLGLGLSISQSLAKALGGRIFVESELNKGSTFYLHLPV